MRENRNSVTGGFFFIGMLRKKCVHFFVDNFGFFVENWSNLGNLVSF